MIRLSNMEIRTKSSSRRQRRQPPIQIHPSDFSQTYSSDSLTISNEAVLSITRRQHKICFTINVFKCLYSQAGVLHTVRPRVP